MATDLVLALTLADEAPADENVVAGPIGFVVFIGLVIALAFLGWSLTRHLRKAKQAADAGVFGEDPTDDARRDTPETGQESR